MKKRPHILWPLRSLISGIIYLFSKRDSSNYTHLAFYPLFGFWIPCFLNSKMDDDIIVQRPICSPLLDLAVWIQYEFHEQFFFIKGKEL